MKKLVVYKMFKRKWRSGRNAQISLHRQPNRADDGKGGNGVGEKEWGNWGGNVTIWRFKVLGLEKLEVEGDIVEK